MRKILFSENRTAFIAYTVLLALMLMAAPSPADNPTLWSSENRASDYEIGDLNGDNVADIIASEYDPDGYSDSSKVYALDGANGSHLWSFWINDGVRSMISGDVTGDGVPDVIIGGSYGTDLYTDGRVRLLNGVDGSQVWQYPFGESVSDLAIGDFNNSGNLDIIAVGFDDFIHAIDGSTGTSLWKKYLGPIFINAVSVGDVNLDGIDDVGYAHEYVVGSDNYYGVLDGTDGSEFWEQTVTYYGSDVLLADIDDDGYVEAVFGMHYADDHAEIHVYDGLSGAQEWTYDFGSMDHVNGCFYLQAFDLDYDKDLDLVVGNNLGHRNIYVFDGDVDTPALISEDLTRFPHEITVGDVDNDGFLDLVAASFDRVQIVNATTGNEMWYYSVSGRIDGVRCADFDSDNWTDIAAGGGADYAPDPTTTVWTLRAIITPLVWEYNFGENGNALAVVDLNQDGHDDVITVVSVDDKATAIDGKTGDVELWAWVGPDNLYSVTHGDFDNDGDPDVAVGGADQQVTALDGTSGDVLWQFETPTETIGRSSLVSTDINGDGADDVVAGSNDNYVYAINGVNGVELWNYPAGSDLEEIILAQMNGTGPLDVVCGLASSANKVLVLDGADGSFLWEYVCANRVEYVEAFDVNGDDVPDIAAGVTLSPKAVYMIDGATHDTLWTRPVDINSTGYALGQGDINGDDVPDVLVGGSYNVNTVYTYNGLNGTPLWTFPIGDEVESILGYDVDGDGDAEVCVGGDDNKLYVIDGDGTELFVHNCADAVKHILVGDISADAEPNIACLTFGFIGVAYAFKSLIPEPNVPPYTPAAPEPDDGASDVLITASLSWIGGDPNTNDQVHYDVYFGAVDPPPLVSDDQLATDYAPPVELLYGTQYFWKIIAFDEIGEFTEGPLWSFTTEYNYICGDANADEDVNVSDAVHIINYVFVGGDPPDPLVSGDVNCDEDVNVSDAVWIINYVFVGGNIPCDTNGDSVPDC
jgi:outer membrane protein assembly factor BamB